ncbi:MAG: terpene cyclase/mutase family protein [Verrucomicrobiales bacterium]|nr:terpene cyclase/mutase family protein [Verrucomicrobiales bacterium]
MLRFFGAHQKLLVSGERICEIWFQNERDPCNGCQRSFPIVAVNLPPSSSDSDSREPQLDARATYPVELPQVARSLPQNAAEEPVAVAAAALPEDELLGGERPPGDLPDDFHPQATHDFGDAHPPNAFVRLWRKVGGGGLTTSLLIHLGLLLLAVTIVFTPDLIEKQVDFLPGGGTQQGAEASSELQHQVQQKKRSTLNKAMPMRKIVSTSQNAAISLPEAPPDLLDVPDVGGMVGGGIMGSGGFGTGGAGGGFGSGVGMGSAAGFVSLPPSMRSRCSSAERLKKLKESGGSSECERAVSQSLEWLASHQNEDGSWGKTYKSAMTGLALLSFLGRCETPDSPFYGDNVMKGIMYLIETGNSNKWGLIAQDPLKHQSSYEHGIATYALGEMYTLARLGSKQLPGMREAFEKGVKLILENQLEDGGWGYGEGGDYCYRRTGRGDLSVTGWQYQALKAAKNTSLPIDNLHKGISHAVEYLEKMQTEDGGFGNTNRDAGYNQWNLSGCGVLGLQTLAKGKSKAIGKGMKFLTDFLTKEPLDWNKNANLYCWYYMTQCYFQQGGEEWKFYNAQILPNLLNNQAEDGAWKEERFNSPIGSTTNAGADRAIYRQTLCTLMLEVYYRYLKVADRDDESFFDR